jgi:dTDP-4-amino-4,6-dideoxygalactose transaminase
LQGAVGLEQLKRLDQYITERANWADWYRDAMAGEDWLRFPAEPQKGRHGWQAFVTWVDPAKSPCSRNEIMERLHAIGIATRPGTHAVHELGWYAKQYNHEPADFPEAMKCAQNTMAIPLHNHMRREDYERVTASLKAIG